jgi:glycosyltransferase involved in cell wall biosynthesis
MNHNQQMISLIDSVLRRHRLVGTRHDQSHPRIFLNWVKYSSRSETIAKAFDAEPFYIPYLQKKGILYVLLRYACASFHSIIFLAWRRPKVVFVMNQPVFLPMLVYLMSFILRFRYVVDSHSGLFNKKRWIWAQPLMRSVCRRSLCTIVTNNNHKAIVEQWGASVAVLSTMIVADEGATRRFICDRPSIVVIGTFAEDEPTAEVFQAASLCPSVQFYVTGDYSAAKPEIIMLRPANIEFTGFLKREEYISLVKSADAAMILVTTDNTMQRGAYEAMSWGTPIITSDWPILKGVFSKGAVFVNNQAQEIAKGVATFMAKKELLRTEIQSLKAEREYEWQRWVQHITKQLERAVG